ncbi:MAG: hypothetical protein ACRCZJ_05200, partial [Erysipelotrichaceae bacterium]
VSIDGLLDETTSGVASMCLVIAATKKSYRKRCAFVESTLKTQYTSAQIYGLTQISSVSSTASKWLDFFTWGISSLPFITEWISQLNLYYLIVGTNESYLVKASKTSIWIESIDVKNNQNQFIHQNTVLQLTNLI